MNVSWSRSAFYASVGLRCRQQTRRLIFSVVNVSMPGGPFRASSAVQPPSPSLRSPKPKSIRIPILRHPIIPSLPLFHPPQCSNQSIVFYLHLLLTSFSVLSPFPPHPDGQGFPLLLSLPWSASPNFFLHLLLLLHPGPRQLSIIVWSFLLPPPLVAGDKQIR